MRPTSSGYSSPDTLCHRKIASRLGAGHKPKRGRREIVPVFTPLAKAANQRPPIAPVALAIKTCIATLRSPEKPRTLPCLSAP